MQLFKEIPSTPVLNWDLNEVRLFGTRDGRVLQRQDGWLVVKALDWNRVDVSSATDSVTEFM